MLELKLNHVFKEWNTYMIIYKEKVFQKLQKIIYFNLLLSATVKRIEKENMVLLSLTEA